MSSSAPSPPTVLEVFDALASPGTPLTTPEVADEFDCTDRTIYNKLEALVDDGSLETKKVGARGRVWWQPPPDREQGDGDDPSVTPAERPVTDLVLTEQTRLVEVIASGTPLEECLSSLCTAVSTLDSTVRASIVLTDDENQSFERCIAPDLSPAWREELEGLPIDDRQIGTCGEAVFCGKPVTCANVATNDRWSDDWQELCLDHNIRAGHSVPIHDADGEPLGSVMLCFDEPKSSCEWEQLADFGTHIASIAIERSRSNRALRESEKRFRGLVDATSEVMYRMSPEWDEIRELSSGGFLADTETPDSDWLDKYIHPDDQPRVTAAIDEAIQTKSTFEFEHRVRQADGTLGWTQSRAVPLLGDDGEITEWFGAARDVTERKQREQQLREQSELEEYGAFVRAVEDYAIFMLDPDGDVTSWNDGAERIKGYTEDDIVGEHFSAFYTDADIDDGVPQANLEAAAAEGHIEDEGWRVRKDGSWFWADVVITAIKDDDGTLQGFTKVTRDMTEQREYERQLRQERDLTEQLLETVPVGICSITSDGDFGRANQRALTCIGCEESDLADYSVDSWNLYDAEGDPIPTDEWPWTRVTETGEPVYDYQCQVDLPDLGRRWFSLNAAPLYDDQSDDPSGEASQTVVALEDITDRKLTTDALAYLNTASRELMEAETQAITERAADITQEVLDVASTSLWRYDEATGDLQLHTASTAAGIDPAAIRYTDDFEERAWRTFVSIETDTSNDFLPAPESDASETPIRSEVILPLGRHGVLCAGSIRPDAFDDAMVDLAGTVAATIETALDRAANEQQLARQNEELTRLDQINSIIRDIDQALVEAETREEIDRVVCEQLSAADLYEFAWIGETDPGTDTIVPREWAGIDPGYLDQLTITTDDTPTGQGPIGTALRTRDPQVVQDIITAARFAPWREHTLEQDVRSCISIPLVYNDTLYGVVTVYAEDPLTNERHHDVVAELGETVANAISSVETKQALQTDSVVELKIQVREPDTILSRLAQQVSCQIEFEGLVSHSAETAQVFITTHGASADEICTAATDSLAIETITTLSESEDGCRFKLVITDPPLASVLIDQDAEIRQLTLDADGATAVVALPTTRDVRSVIETVQTTFPETELISRRTGPRSRESLHTRRAVYEKSLTDRQQETLRTAYLSGFFESPRGTTGQEIAEAMNVSQPTFAQHLRAGQRNLFEMLFNGSE